MFYLSFDAIFLPVSLSKMGRKEVYDLVLGGRGAHLGRDTSKRPNSQEQVFSRLQQALQQKAYHKQLCSFWKSLPVIYLGAKFVDIFMCEMMLLKKERH